jgi:cytidylate kinase
MAVVTISRGSASGGFLLAQKLGEKLGYEIVSREDVIREAARFGASEETLQEALLKPPTFWDRFKHERRRYLAFVQAALCERAQKDRIVYHGNAGHLLLCGVPHVLRVRLIASMPFRIRMVMERQHLSQSEAIRYIENADRQRRDWTRFLYAQDWLDPLLYDLVIKLETLTVESAAEVAAAAVQRPELQATEASRKAMDDLVLASRVRAALAANEKTASVELKIQADDGVVSLGGRVRPADLVESVLRVAGEVEGVRQVDRSDLEAPDYRV